VEHAKRSLAVTTRTAMTTIVNPQAESQNIRPSTKNAQFLSADRVAGWRAGQVTIKEPDHVSTPPPLIPDVGNCPVRLEEQALSDRLPDPPQPVPG